MVVFRSKQSLALSYAAIFAISSLLYVLLFQVQNIVSNPINRSAGIAFTLLIPAVVGLWYGRQPGFLAGIGGPILLLLIPGKTLVVLYAIIAHAITGYLCGYWKENKKMSLASAGLVIGHIIFIVVNLILGNTTPDQIMKTSFLLGLGFEVVMGVFGINMLALIYNELKVITTSNKRLLR